MTFSVKRQREMLHGLIAVLCLGLVVGGNLVTRIWLNQSQSSFTQWFAPAIPATIVAAMSLSCAAAVGLWRFVVYGLIFAIAGLSVAATATEPWWGLAGGGTAAILWGAIMFARFLRNFPKRSKEAED